MRIVHKQFLFSIVLGAIMALFFTIEAGYGLLKISSFYKGVLITIGMGFLTLGWSGLYRAIGYKKISIMTDRNRIIFIISQLLLGGILLLVLMIVLPNGIVVSRNPWGYLLINISLASIFVAIGYTVVYFLERYYLPNINQLEQYLDEAANKLKELIILKERIESTTNEFVSKVEEIKSKYEIETHVDPEVKRTVELVLKKEFTVSLLMALLGAVFGCILTVFITLLVNGK